MAQNEGQRRASSAVAAEMARREWNISDLVQLTGIDPGTIGDFLNGKRWPKIGTQGKIEKAIGWESGSIRGISLGEPVPVNVTVRVPSITATSQVGTPTVSAVEDDEVFEVRMRRPQGVTLEEWKRMKEDWREELEFKLNRAARER
jgi:hypothetical protein